MTFTMTRFVDEGKTNAGIFKALAIVPNHSIPLILCRTIGALLGTFGPLFPIGDHFKHYYARDGDWREQKYFMEIWLWSRSAPVFHRECASGLQVSLGIKRRGQSFYYCLNHRCRFEDFLERLHFIWKRLRVSPTRSLLMSLSLQTTDADDHFGVAGSVILLFAGLGIQSSVGRGFQTPISRDLILWVSLASQKNDASSQESRN